MLMFVWRLFVLGDFFFCHIHLSKFSRINLFPIVFGINCFHRHLPWCLCLPEGVPCPSLLRDLLAQPLLEEIIGSPAVSVVYELRQDPPPSWGYFSHLWSYLLNFFVLFERSWKNMKNDTTFVRMRSSDHLGDAKMSKKGTSLCRI